MCPFKYYYNSFVCMYLLAAFQQNLFQPWRTSSFISFILFIYLKYIYLNT